MPSSQLLYALNGRFVALGCVEEEEVRTLAMHLRAFHLRCILLVYFFSCCAYLVCLLCVSDVCVYMGLLHICLCVYICVYTFVCMYVMCVCVCVCVCVMTQIVNHESRYPGMVKTLHLQLPLVKFIGLGKFLFSIYILPFTLPLF